MIKEGSRDKRATSVDCSTVFIVDLEQVLAQRELTKPIIIYRTQVYILIALSDKLKQQYPLLLKRMFRWATNTTKISTSGESKEYRYEKCSEQTVSFFLSLSGNFTLYV